MSKHIPAFEKFIEDLRAVWKELPDTESRMKRGQKLLEGLVKDESLRQASKSCSGMSSTLPPRGPVL